MMDARAAIVALRSKYLEMKRLRVEDAGGSTRDPKGDMARLAQQFPGALREIDDLPMDEIDARIAALDETASGGRAAPEWALWMISYHGWMRAALRIKRLVAVEAGSRSAVAIVRDAYRCESGDEPEPESLTDEMIEAIVSPAEGRLNPWIFARVAEEHGADRDLVERALFPRRRTTG